MAADVITNVFVTPSFSIIATLLRRRKKASDQNEGDESRSATLPTHHDGEGNSAIETETISRRV